ncbi:uncharacterized protein LOC131935470 [Physella acuta]|uniref:uncharacterized protein LOC131935470 n=1 Tax=Physella acuta TaxID=109671 RepID=UPI0027DC6103|nr:uncharacterized protein LOC131935470 [Physella acuta]
MSGQPKWNRTTSPTKIPKSVLRLKCRRYWPRPSCRQAPCKPQRLARNRHVFRLFTNKALQRKKHGYFSIKIAKENSKKEQKKCIEDKNNSKNTMANLETKGSAESESVRLCLMQASLLSILMYVIKALCEVKNDVGEDKNCYGNYKLDCSDQDKIYSKNEKEDDEGNMQLQSKQGENLIHRSDLEIFNELCSFENIFIKPQGMLQVFHVGSVIHNHPISVEGIPWEKFREERLRIVTYVKYPKRGRKSAMLLAENGFVYTGDGNDNDDRVTCYSCCSTHGNWHLLDDVAEVHRRISPVCSMVTHINSDNIPVVVNENLMSNFSSLLEKAESITFSHHQEVKEKHAPLSEYNHFDYTYKDKSYKKNSKRNKTRKTKTRAQSSSLASMDIESDSAPSFRHSLQDSSSSSNIQPLNMQLPSARPKQLALGTSVVNSSQSPQVVGTVLSNVVNNTQDTRSLAHGVKHQGNPANDIEVDAAPEISYETANSSIQVQIALPKTVRSKPDESPARPKSNPAHLNSNPARPNSNPAPSNPTPPKSNPAPSLDSRTTSSNVLPPNPNSLTSNASQSQTRETPVSGDQSNTTQPASQTTPFNSSDPTPAATGTTDATPSVTTNANSGNTSKTGKRNPTYAELGIITERPKRPEYAVKVKRQETYGGWPRDHHLTIEELVDAGFYYAGYGDCARCFYCGGGLRNWEDEDNVYVEHARWFPKCAFIRQLMGQVFVDVVQKLNKDRDQIPFSLVLDTLKKNSSTFQLESRDEPLKRDPAVQVVVDMGYGLQDAVNTAKLVKQENSIISADVLLEKLHETKTPRDQTKILQTPLGLSSDKQKSLETMRTLKEQNNQLRQQTVCKICMDQEVAVVFLPCGHLVSCGECASAMSACPVCRKQVKGTVRAFMG